MNRPLVFFLLRTRRKVRGEVALLFLGYNLKRAVKIMGFRGIMDRLEALSRRFFHILRICATVLPREALSALTAA